MLQDKSKKKQRFMWFRKISEYWTLSTALCLAGCMGIYEEGFDCPPGKGVGCKSISEVNAMVNQGLLPKPNKDLDSQLDPQFSQSSSSEGEEDASSCKNCAGSHSSLSSNKMSSSKISIWWAPQGGNFKEDKAPLDLLPQRGV